MSSLMCFLFEYIYYVCLMFMYVVCNIISLVFGLEFLYVFFKIVSSLLISDQVFFNGFESVVVVVRLPRPMEGNGVTPIFSRVRQR